MIETKLWKDFQDKSKLRVIQESLTNVDSKKLFMDYLIGEEKPSSILEAAIRNIFESIIEVYNYADIESIVEVIESVHGNKIKAKLSYNRCGGSSCETENTTELLTRIGNEVLSETISQRTFDSSYLHTTAFTEKIDSTLG